MRALGVDFGSRRIGVAISSGSVASPYEMVERSGDVALDHRRLLALAIEAEVDVIVVGMPYSLDGSLGPAAQAIESELVELRCSTSIPIETYDERLTTVTATRLLQEAGVKGKDRRQLIDKMAAAVLLQAWIDGRPSTSSDSGL